MKKTIQTEFKNSDEFIEFIKPKFENVNFDDYKIFNKLKTIFIQNQSAKATITNLIKIVRVGLGFKAKSTLQIEFYLERGWSEEYGKTLISRRQSKNSLKAKENGSWKGRFTKEWYKERYPLDWEKRYTEKHSKTSGSLDNFVRKYGKTEGLIKYEKTNTKRTYSNSKEGFIENFGETVGLEKWNTKIHKHKEAVSEDFFIKRYGVDSGKSKWANRNKTISYKNSFDYYIEQFGEEGKSILSSKRRRSLEEFIKLYGKDGQKKWDNYIELLDSKSNIQYSKISEELFDSLGIVEAKYGKEERLFTLDIKTSKKLNRNYIKPDFIIGNKIIEFYGDLWHGNPAIFEADDEFNPYFQKDKLAMNQWSEDAVRIKWLENEGFQVLIIWESDYIKDKWGIITQCLEFIGE